MSPPGHPQPPTSRSDVETLASGSHHVDENPLTLSDVKPQLSSSGVDEELPLSLSDFKPHSSGIRGHHVDIDPLSLSDIKPRLSSSGVVVEEPPSKRHLYVEEIKSMWNLAKLSRKLGTREQAMAFAEEKGLIPKTKICNYHKKPMSIDLSSNKTVGSFACHKGPCKLKSRVSRANGTWFENIRITLPQVFYLMYAYANKWSYNFTLKEDFTNDEQCLSRATINDWFTRCREAVVLYQINKRACSTGKIGGEGKIVQIDESIFEKRKYYKGRHIEGLWVLGMIEKGSDDLRLEICPDNIRTAEVLVPLIQKHVAEGTIIQTNFWQAYDCLGENGFIHHKQNCSDPENPFVSADGTHNEIIESQWRVIKEFLSKDNLVNRENFTDLLYEYMWRRDNMTFKRDSFEELIKVVKYVYK